MLLLPKPPPQTISSGYKNSYENIRQWTFDANGNVNSTTPNYISSNTALQLQTTIQGAIVPVFKLYTINGDKIIAYIETILDANSHDINSTKSEIRCVDITHANNSFTVTPPPNTSLFTHFIQGFEYVPALNFWYYSWVGQKTGGFEGGISFYNATSNHFYDISSSNISDFYLTDLELAKNGYLYLAGIDNSNGQYAEYGANQSPGKLAYINTTPGNINTSTTTGSDTHEFPVYFTSTVNISSMIGAYVDNINSAYWNSGTLSYYLTKQIYGDPYNTGIASYTVTGNETWSPSSNPFGGTSANNISSGNIYNGITIAAGASLTLNNMTLHFAPGSSLTVNANTNPLSAGGKLYVNNSTLTSNSVCGDGTWLGVSVLGDPNHSHYYPCQGYAEIKNGSIISNAWNGVSVGNEVLLGNWWQYTGTGGIVKANGSYFYNNRIGCSIYPFNIGNYLVNPSSFTNCSFSWDDNSPWRYSNDYMVGIYGVNIGGVSVKGCTFTGATSSMLAKTYGIFGTDFGFSVDQYTTINPLTNTSSSTPSSFSYLQYGIYNSSVVGNHTMSVLNSNFSNNNMGVVSSGISAPIIQNNDFENSWQAMSYNNFSDLSNSLGNTDQTIGVLIHTGTGYEVNNNIFTSTNYTNSSGALAWNTGSDPNSIHDNNYSDLGVGNNSNYSNYGVNSSNFYDGLQFRCNSYGQDILYHQAALGTNASIHGIKPQQGTALSPEGDVFGDATLPPNSCTHIYNPNSGTQQVIGIDYYYDASPGANPYFDPVNPSGGIVGSINILTTSNPASCAGGTIGVTSNNPITVIGSSPYADAYMVASHNASFYLNNAAPDDSTAAVYHDSAYYWAGQIGTAYGDLLIANLLVQDSLPDSAKIVYDHIAGKYGLTGQEAAEFGWGRKLLDMQIVMRQNGSSYKGLNCSQKDTLKQVADSARMWAHARAANWLRLYGGEQNYVDTLLFPDTTSGSGEGRQVRPAATGPTINNKVYPNPAQRLLYVDYSCTDGSSATMLIEDVAGREVMRQSLPQNGTSTIDIGALQPGMYLYKISEGKAVKMSGKIVRVE